MVEGVPSAGQMSSYNMITSFLFRGEGLAHPKIFKSFVGDAIGPKAIQLFNG
jgi:hypothetical protein